MGVEMSADKIAIIILLAGILCIICAALIVFADYCARKYSLKRMYDMIQRALDGTFRAHSFDESLYAAVENKLAEYIDASETSAGKTAKEKEHVRSSRIEEQEKLTDKTGRQKNREKFVRL